MNAMTITIYIALATLLYIVKIYAVTLYDPGVKNKKPHIIFIMADDLVRLINYLFLILENTNNTKHTSIIRSMRANMQSETHFARTGAVIQTVFIYVCSNRI